jgi:hypothetical protein
MAEFIIPKLPKLSTLRNQKTPINDRIGLATQYITDLATLQTCPLKSSRKGGMSKCTCLHDHFSGQQDSAALARRVGTAVVEFCSFSRDRRSEYLMTVIKYSRMPFFGQGKKSRNFVLPERDFAANDANESDDDEDDNISLPRPICQSALMMVLGINSDAWRTVSKAADTNVIPQHKLVSKPSNNAMNAETTSSLKKYFEGLKEHACPRATRVVQTHAGTALRDDSDEHELPTNWTKRAVFARWLKENGYSIATDGRGVSIITETVEGDADIKACTWPTFRLYWKKNHSKMIIPRARADICGDCFVAVNGFRSNKSKLRSANYLVYTSDSDSDSDDEDEDDCEEREQILIDAAQHCCNAKGQREYFNRLTAEAKEANHEGMAHILRRWVLVADYCQNMGIPHFGGEQPGETYYFSPLSCYCFGVADPLRDQDHLYANMYHEGQGQKGGNNVASLLLKVLKQIGAFKEDEFGGPLTIVMDNCGGQNKNRMVLRTALFLVECGYFSSVLLLFLVRGHTKNNCDRLFNLLKDHFHKQNVYSYPQLLDVLKGEHKTILETQEGEFQDWDAFLDRWYKQVPSGWIQVNHNFQVESGAPTVMKFSVAEGKEVSSFDFKKKDSGRQEQRVAEMRAAARTVLPFPGIKEIKQAELFKKWRHYVPLNFKDEACPKPASDVLERQRVEKNEKARKKKAVLDERKEAAKKLMQSVASAGS